MGVLLNGAVDGRLVPEDRGLAYGDGVFRTLRLRDGRPVCWARQYRKLQGDCEAIGLRCPTPELLKAELGRAGEGLREGVGKVIVTRGAGQRGYAPPTHPEPNRIVSVGPLPAHPPSFREEGIRVHRCRLRLAIQPRLAGIKHLNRLENVLARMEWTDPAIAEGLLLDAEGYLTEGIASNLFLVREGVLHTPDLSRCGVSGVTRERIMAIALFERVPLRMARLQWQDLLHADEAILVNSLIGAWQIRCVQGREWDRGIWTPRIRGWLDASED
ncbi:MAG: aminodeoxychorismate lyase [Burkholderiales bacterium]